MKRTSILRRTPLRRVSKKRAKENAVYLKKRAEFLREHPYCQVCLDELGVMDAGDLRGLNIPRATDIHHVKGRGKYFLDETTWLAVSRQAHMRIHENPSWSRSRGYLV